MLAAVSAKPKTHKHKRQNAKQNTKHKTYHTTTPLADVKRGNAEADTHFGDVEGHCAPFWDVEVAPGPAPARPGPARARPAPGPREGLHGHRAPSSAETL